MSVATFSRRHVSGFVAEIVAEIVADAFAFFEKQLIMHEFFSNFCVHAFTQFFRLNFLRQSMNKKFKAIKKLFDEYYNNFKLKIYCIKNCKKNLYPKIILEDNRALFRRVNITFLLFFIYINNLEILKFS